uniref:Probable polygalacturonase At3g15720 n=1 Tax=Cicer arietinum TaxID=3827 RepID=A0A1S2YBE9_CICAR|nr:probable polygalacturonase At3g15720 [Cicer arietinum]
MKGLYIVLTCIISSLASLCVAITPNTNGTFDVLNYGAIGDGSTDDSNAFLKAWTDVCGTTIDTPTMIIPEGKTFLLQPLSFKGPCNSSNVIIELRGNITAPKDIEAWKFEYESELLWIQFSTISGLVFNGSGGQINGQGAPWWLKFPKNQEKYRPSALKFKECQNLTVFNSTHFNSPKNHISIHSCKNATIYNLQIIAPEDSPNTDGIDISTSTNIQIMNSTMETGDDCIAINAGSSYINITNIFCGPGHGISVGSLGKGENYEAVEEVYVKNCTFTGTSNGARIKTWKGGSGHAWNIKYEDIKLDGVKNPVIIDQNYDPLLSDMIGSAVEVKNVTYNNIKGTSINGHAIQFFCDSNIGCTNIVLNDINITKVDGGETHASCNNAHGTYSSCYPPVSCFS